MGIGSYKEAERYRMRTNKNLTRSFYLDTRRTLDEEPFAWEQTQDAGIMQPGAVQEFSDGGRVGFKTGGDVQDWAIDSYPDVNFDFDLYICRVGVIWTDIYIKSILFLA